MLRTFITRTAAGLALAACALFIVISRGTAPTVLAIPFFKDFALVRISRLSVMPVSDAQWKRIEKLAEQA